MRPIALRFNGINSYSTEQQINFENITRFRVFGIVGKTGSGKTTIIDCIILALYGRMARDESKTPKNFINADVSECFVEFKFSSIINKIEKTFIITRAYKLSKDGLKCYKSSLVEIVENAENVLCSNKLTELNTLIEEIVGLKYEYFTKAVILPQGKFSEFLTLKNKEKGEMLEQIFSLDKYGEELTSKFNREKGRISTEVKNINSRIEEISIDFKVGELEEEIKKEVLNKDAVSRDIVSNKKALEKDKEIFRIIELLYKSEHELSELLKKKNEIDFFEKNIDKYKNAFDINEKILSRDKSRKLVFEKREEYKKIEMLENKLAQELNAFTEENKKFQSEKEENYQSLIEKIAKIQTLDEAYKSLDSDIKKQSELRNSYLVKNKELKGFNDELERINKRKGDFKETEKRLEINIKENVVNVEKIDIINSGLRLLEEIKDIDDNILSKTNDLENIFIERKKINDELDASQDLHKKILALIDKQKQNKKTYYSQLLKNELEIGDKCPICNEVITNLTHNDVQENEFDDSIDEKAKTSEIFINSVKNKLEYKVNEIEKLNKELKEKKEQREKLLKMLNDIKEKNNIIDFLSLKSQISKKTENYEKYSKELEILKKDNANIDIEKEICDKKIAQITSEMEEITINGKYLSQKINDINEKIKVETNGESIKEYQEKLIAKRTYFIDTEKIFSERKEDFDKTKNKLNIDKNTFELNIVNFDNQIINISQEIEREMKKNGFFSEEEIKEFILTEEKVEEIIKNIQDFKNKKLLLDNEIIKQKENLEIFNIDLDEIEFECLKERVYINEKKAKELEEQHTNIIKKISELETKLKRASDDVARIKEYEKTLKVLRKELDNLEEITNLLKGNRFVQYIAKRYLDNICMVASKKLYEMSGGKYSLEAFETDFVVIDHNRGNVKRQIKSISGGELFMVSLCLSLALSTYIARKNSGSIDMFFLDEGFGSLDDETLDNVVDILFKASSEDLKIGLITHVTKIQENLPSKLLVYEDNNIGSSMIKMG